MNEDRSVRGGERETAWQQGASQAVVSTSVLELLSPVVGAVFALHAEVDVGADAAVVQRLDRANVVAHAQEDLRRLVLAQQPQGVHLRQRQRENKLVRKKSWPEHRGNASQASLIHCIIFFPGRIVRRIRQKKSRESFVSKSLACFTGRTIVREKIPGRDRQSPVSFRGKCRGRARRPTLTCMRVRYTGLFIRIHVAVSKHGGMVIDPSYVMKLLVSG